MSTPSNGTTTPAATLPTLDGLPPITTPAKETASAGVTTPAAPAADAKPKKARKHTIVNEDGQVVSGPGAEKVAEKAKNPGSVKLVFEGPAIDIALSDIIAEEATNTTRPEGVGDVRGLAESIAAVGQRQPVVVAREGKKYRLAAGFRRFAAIASLKLKTVNAQVLVDPTQAALANVAENEDARSNVSPLGRMGGYLKLQEQGHSFKEIAQVTGRAEDFVRDHCRINKSDPCIAEALAHKDTHEDYVPWAVCRLVLRRDIKDQPKLLAQVRGLSVVAATEVLSATNPRAKGKSKKSSSASSNQMTEKEVVSTDKVAERLIPRAYAGGEAVVHLREVIAETVKEGKFKESAFEACANIFAKLFIKFDADIEALAGEKAAHKALKEFNAAQKEK